MDTTNPMVNAVPDIFKLSDTGESQKAIPKGSIVVVTNPGHDSFRSVGVVKSHDDKEGIVLVETKYDIIMARFDEVTPINSSNSEAVVIPARQAVRVLKIARRMTGGVPSEAELVQLNFSPTRKRVRKDDVKSNILHFGSEEDLGLIEAAARNEGMAYSIGGDIRTNTPPYIFMYRKGRWEDNVATAIEEDVIEAMVKSAAKRPMKTKDGKYIQASTYPFKMAENPRGRRNSNVQRSLIKKVSSKLNDMIGNKYFEQIPLDDIFKVCSKNGLWAVDEDGTPWAGFMAGRDGHANIEVAFQNVSGEWVVAKNTMIVLTWHKMDSGDYEIVCYMS